VSPPPASPFQSAVPLFIRRQLMKVSKGQGNPAVMNKMLNERLKGEN
jgi:Asp-tRNA(Asn)/Glu-tRNA(Gln) amidotransferase B subunit